jgi:large subunit ribosomal protein L19
MMNQIERIERFETGKLVPRSVTIGNTVRVHVKIVEGEKERIQVYEGVVMRQKGTRNRQTFTVRKSSFGIWVERIFPLYSPYITQIDVVREGKVCRAKLYDLRGRTGRAAKLAEKRRIIVKGPKSVTVPADSAGQARAEAAAGPPATSNESATSI